MTTYTITVNDTETATTTNFDTMIAFIDSIRGIDSWNLDYTENGRTLNMANRGINAYANFSECVKTSRMGR